MATACIDLAPLLPLDPFTDPSSVGQRWTSWLRRFETYLLAILDITDAKRKRVLLLYRVGQQTQEIFDTIPEDGAADDYQTAVGKLD
eukprot:gene5538-2295_t